MKSGLSLLRLQPQTLWSTENSSRHWLSNTYRSLCATDRALDLAATNGELVVVSRIRLEPSSLNFDSIINVRRCIGLALARRVAQVLVT